MGIKPQHRRRARRDAALLAAGLAGLVELQPQASTLCGKSITEYAQGMGSDLLRTKPCRNPQQPFLGLGVRSSLARKEWTADLEH